MDHSRKVRRTSVSPLGVEVEREAGVDVAFAAVVGIGGMTIVGVACADEYFAR